jgi:hypothetical protein
MYMTAAKACNLKSEIPVAEDTFIKITAFGKEQNIHSSQTLTIIENLDFYTLRGIEGFKKSPNIKCTEVKRELEKLHEIAVKIN